MLELMRKHARNWIMKVLLGIIIVVFIFYFGSMTARRKADAIATVDGKIISYVEYQKEYRDLIEMYNRRSGGRLTEEMIKGLNLKEQALNKLIYQAVLTKKAQELKIMVTDEEVSTYISLLPAFQRDGVFDNRLYQQMLRYNKTTPEEFESEQRKSLLIMKLEDLIQDGVHVSDGEVKSFYEAQSEKINIAFLRLRGSDFAGKVRVETAALEKYRQEHQADFRSPEQVQIKYLFFGPEAFQAQVKVTEEEIADFYENNKQKYAKGGKNVPLANLRDQIIAEIKHGRAMKLAFEAARQARETIYQQENFEAYAAAHRLKVEKTGFFTEKDPPEAFRRLPDFSKIVFSLQKDEISKVISSERGYYLFQVGVKKPAYTPDLKEIEREVRQRYTAEEGRRLARQEAEAALARLRKGEKLADIGRNMNFKVEETGYFLPTAPAPRIGSSPALVKALFLLAPQKPYGDEVFTMENDYLLVEFRGREKSEQEIPPERMDQLRKAYLHLKRNEAIQAWIEASKSAMLKEGKLKINKDPKEL
ncbi:MAG TPA: SurA N-terminal domain-containing protein [Syntrophales bacterium]|nr:SurA N-terminal domain-containing protein [Syntrophales bacterium]HOU76737.1 SurA N-terminal domain-containing protein [Syntrophales bacterium]HPC31860.1 SurA N-terminal domain-containing protein [Syntrophales bacterium]HQG33449.1 SurA N-terminal domain-containing protein [Syntrophales bacterium]HQI34695.1 SurA N-terminal domain-containing protein [Syntrophales bacterium]